MSAASAPRLRDDCPTAWSPMASGDGKLARLALPEARLSADAAIGLDGLARAYGNGLIEITGRGNLQVRGLDAGSAPGFAAGAAALGLAPADAGARVRLGASPFAADDRATAALIRALAPRLAALDGLPPKFTVHVEGGRGPAGPSRTGSGNTGARDGGAAGGAGTDAVRADISVRDAGGLIALGGARQARCPPARAADAVVAIARAFAREGARRMRALSDEALDRLLAACGLDGRPAEAWDAPDPVGDVAPGAIGVAPPFGAFSSGGLAAVARLASSQGDGLLRLAPRALLLGGLADPDAARREAVGLGLVVEAADPRRRLHACAGAPACASGWQAARDVAARFLPLVPRDGVLHLSGCAKGCAHPGAAALVLVGMAEGGYRVLRHARADAA